MVQVRICRFHYDGRYILNQWDGNVEDIFTLAETLGLD